MEYLGYRIDAQGLYSTASKVNAIMNAPASRNVSELRSFLGLLNYYGRFVANLPHYCTHFTYYYKPTHNGSGLCNVNMPSRAASNLS